MISVVHGQHRIVAVGNKLHVLQKERTKVPTDFLSDYLKRLLTREWWDSDVAKPLTERHAILQWYDILVKVQESMKPDANGLYLFPRIGAAFAWFRLANDLYLINHNAELQEKMLNRLRNRGNFQGARFELCVLATIASAGFKIEYEDESDSSSPHTEFFATHPSGVRVAIEAKSRRRPGLLHEPHDPKAASKPLKLGVESLIQAALKKKPGMPFFIFVEVNLPDVPNIKDSYGWLEAMVGSVEKIQQRQANQPLPANNIFFCNDPTYQAPEAELVGPAFYGYSHPIVPTRYALKDETIPYDIEQAFIHRANPPCNFPDTNYGSPVAAV